MEDRSPIEWPQVHDAIATQVADAPVVIVEVQHGRLWPSRPVVPVGIGGRDGGGGPGPPVHAVGLDVREVGDAGVGVDRLGDGAAARAAGEEPEGRRLGPEGLGRLPREVLLDGVVVAGEEYPLDVAQRVVVVERAELALAVGEDVGLHHQPVPRGDHRPDRAVEGLQPPDGLGAARGWEPFLEVDDPHG